MMVKPDRRSFPMRNRIVAGLSHGVVVVEAGTRSGALITAEQALEQGRYVFAVPGHVTAPQAHGCHRLIRDGARLVESMADVLDEFCLLPMSDNAPAPRSTAPPEAVMPPLNGVETRVIGSLARGEQTLDQLHDSSGLAVTELMPVLLALEIKRLVVQLPGKRFRLNTGDTPAPSAAGV
jgi:DNA processing protein